MPCLPHWWVGLRPEAGVQVRFVHTDVFEPHGATTSQALGVLGDAERAVHARLRQEAARRDYLAAHWLAHHMIGEVAGCAPDRVRLCTPAHEKPSVMAPVCARQVEFSISHADGLAACAVSPGFTVGVDVEHCRNLGPDLMDLAATVCTRREYRALAAMPARHRAERMLTLWTCKEAVAKASGLGARLDFADLDVERQGDWSLATWPVAEGYIVAVAVPAHGLGIGFPTLRPQLYVVHSGARGESFGCKS